MKREFLQNFKIGDQSLPKEVIDAILDEHSRSIGTLKAENDSLRTQLQTAKDGLKAFEGVDVKDLQGRITKLQQDLADKDAAHQAELADRDFNQRLDAAIAGAKGRNATAIKSLLKLDDLKGSKNQEADIKAALEGLQKDSGYLFDTGEVPPPYAAGTGTAPYRGGQSSDATLRAAMGLPAKSN